MNSSKANLLNSIILIAVGSWGYFDSDGKSITALIPVIFGVILLLCTNGIKNQNKIIAHIAVLVTLIALLGLTMPLKAAVADGRTLSIIRVAAMLLTGSLAMISFIKSFIAARKKS